MIVRRCQIVMRTSDFKLNITQICNVAKLNEKRRRKYLQILKIRCDITKIKVKEKNHSWVLFKNGVFFCQTLKISEEMKPLFSQRSLTFSSEEINYFMNSQKSDKTIKSTFLSAEFKALTWSDKFVTYISSTQRVNATKFLKLNNILKIKFAEFFFRNLTAFKQTFANNAQKTYITFENVKLLCQNFKLSEDPLDEIIKQKKTIDILRLKNNDITNIHHHENNCDFENNDIFENKNLISLFEHSVNEFATTVVNFFADNIYQISIQSAEFILNTDHYFRISELCHEYESFFASEDQSYLFWRRSIRR